MCETIEKCPVCKTECSNGATKCSVCGFTDENGIDRTWPIKEDAEYWLETVVKPYRVLWEARKRESELLAQLEEAKKRETELLARLAIREPPVPIGWLLIDDVVGIEMVFVRGGTFNMGAIAEQGGDCRDDEKPAHSVTLSDFYIGKYVVTQKQWNKIMGSNQPYFKRDNLPIENVSSNNLEYFIYRLNRETGKKYRLPTEAEWEYAARGGNKSKGYKYAGSNNIDDVAWYDKNSGGKTHPVGLKTSNELGIHDMSGNVREWVNDWYDGGYYKESPKNNPAGPARGLGRVYRGGSWFDNAQSCRVSYRNYFYPSNSGDFFLGFRLALSP